MATWLAMELQDEPTAAPSSVAEDFFVNRGGALAERLQLVYIDRAAQYLKDLDKEYNALPNGGFRQPGEFPTVVLGLPLGMVTVKFDAEVDAQLLFVYVVHGWSGIQELEKAIEQRLVYLAIGRREPWGPVLAFFRVARHLLALRIREALISVESTLRRTILEQISASKEVLDDAIAQLQIKAAVPERPPPQSGAEGGPGSNQSQNPEGFRAHNDALLQDAYSRISAVFQKGQVLARLRRDLEQLDERLGARRRALKESTEGLSGGVIPPSERADLPEAKDVERLEQERARLAREAVEVEQGLQQLSDAMGTLLPPLLLAVPQLKDEFTRADFDRAVVETIISMRQLIEEILPATVPGPSSVAAHVPFDETSLERIQEAARVPMDIAAIVADRALARIGDDRAQTALVDEQTLRTALARGAFPLGGFEYIVATHYALALIDAVEAKRKSEAVWKSIAEISAKLSAFASLSAGVASLGRNPAALLAAGSLRLVAFGLSLPALIYCAYSVVYQLSKLDQAIRLRVASADFTDIESVTQLGELVELRSSQANEIASSVAQLVFENFAAGRFAGVKKLLLWRGYLYDIETLLPEEAAAAEPGTESRRTTNG